MTSELMKQFVEFLEKQDVIDKLIQIHKLDKYGYSEIHTIMMIDKLEEPNVTKIANAMNMTRGAVSKITHKLIADGSIESYMKEGNRQKIYFRLTPKGDELNREHAKRHISAEKRDTEFFKRFDADRLNEIYLFMEKYNAYLQECIETLEKTKRGEPDE